jgi:hypothetical protein
MKTAIIATALTMSLLSACSSSDKSSGKGLDCPATCARAKQCNPNILEDTCRTDCQVTANSLVASAQEAIAACPTNTCDATSTCQSQAIERCMSTSEDVASWVTSLCQAATQCTGSAVTAEQCLAGLTEVESASLRCFSPSARDQLLSCALERCGRPDAVLDCGRDIMPMLEELATGFAP